jgi:hypothetical protein
MREWIIAACVYIPASLIGEQLAHYIDPFAAGWITASFAVLLRTRGPAAIRAA